MYRGEQLLGSLLGESLRRTGPNDSAVFCSQSTIEIFYLNHLGLHGKPGSLKAVCNVTEPSLL